jgi:hypothetical protein
MPFRLADLEKTLVRADRRIVDEDVDRPELLERCPGESLRLIGPADVAHQHDRLDAKRLPEPPLPRNSPDCSNH